MKKKRTTEQRVKQFLDEIDWMFQVNNFDKTVTMKELDFEEEDGSRVARIIYDYEYQKIEIEIYPLFKEYSIKKQRKVLLHELCHILHADSRKVMINMLDGKFTPQNGIERINETETSKTENIIDALLVGRLRYAKRAYANYIKN